MRLTDEEVRVLAWSKDTVPLLVEELEARIMADAKLDPLAGLPPIEQVVAQYRVAKATALFSGAVG